MIHLRAIEAGTRRMPEGFPFDLPVVRALQRVEFDEPVTFFVGENGSGKSTMIEALAAGAESVTIGGESIMRDPTLAHARALVEHLKLVWNKRTRRGFFMRAEDFFGYARRMRQAEDDHEKMAEAFEAELEGEALKLAQRAALSQKHAIQARYGDGLDAQSHGESFLKLFRERFVPGGLYLLDEPEAPLSPQRQIALLAQIKQMVAEQDAQFIIATHSPILMSYPDASIYSFESTPIRQIAFDDVEHVTITRDFLNNPAAFLRHL